MLVEELDREYITSIEKKVAWDIYEVVKEQFSELLNGCYERRIHVNEADKIVELIDYSEYNGYVVQEIEYVPLNKLSTRMIVQPMFTDYDGYELMLARLEIIKLRNGRCYYELTPNSKVVKMIAKELYGE
jgi:hypothetical protein